MSEIQNTYPVFESNQVLTSTQLNSLVNYLDQQNRLTRAKLIGMGVVCGLEINYYSSSDKITISKGTGITSEGYLINMGDCETVKYRPYKLPPGTIYEPFVGANNQQDINLWELLTSEAEDDENVKMLDDETFLADKVVLLFIESFDKDLKSCLGKSCDELGKQRILTLRKLLISKVDLQKVWNRTNTGKLDAVFEDKFELPVVNMPRVLFNPENSNASDYDAFSQNYAKAVLLIFEDFLKALNQTWDVYQPLLMDSYNEENPFDNSKINTLINKLLNFLNNSGGFDEFLGVQYVYDLFTDLILAYNAFKNTAFDLMSECCPDMDRFPKHLMLGEAIPPAISICEKSEFRHHFVQPPIYNLQKQLVKKSISQHRRIVLMLESFSFNKINKVSDELPLRITPSLEKTTTLCKRSIPWYYDVNKKGSYGLGTLKDYWSFDVSRKCPAEEDGLVLNYDDQAKNQSEPKDKLSTPLYYDIQDSSFLRIEGYIGKNNEAVLKAIEKLKQQFDLPFKTVSLQLGKESGETGVNYSCGFNDIQEEYFALRNNLRAFINDIFQQYLFVLELNNLLSSKDEQVQKYLSGINKLRDMLMNIEKSLPDCVGDFDFEAFQNEYKTILEFILKFFIVQMNVKSSTAELEAVKNATLKVLPTLLLDLHLYNRFFSLYHSLKRREYHLSQKSKLFSEFIKKHPGVSHGAGVPKGGTFIIVSDRKDGTQVIADFYLPYLCCTEDCIPMCEEEDGFRLDVKPFARPDYAVTGLNKAVEINVLRNDFNLPGAAIDIEPDVESKNGGRIKLNGKNVVFTPAKDFSGVDSFHYKVINQSNKLSDEGLVVIVVGEPVAVGGCYSIPILECWGEERVRVALKERGISVTTGADIYNLLLESLRSTAGFTVQEIETSILESEPIRRDLLNCIGIPIDATTTYDQLESLILGYQKQNCGSGSTGTCFSRAILECWGPANVKHFVAVFGIGGGADDIESMLNYLTEKGGFATAEMNWLLEMQLMQPLLKCIDPNTPDTLTNAEMIARLTEYQKANCQGGGSSRIVVSDTNILTRADMVAVLEARGTSTPTSETRDKVEARFVDSRGSNNLTESEMMLLSDISIKKMLDSRNISHTTTESKTELISKLL